MTSTPRSSIPSADGNRGFAAGAPTDVGGGRRARRRSLFSRGEDALAHAVYGLILTIATLGELIHHEVASGVAVAWLVGAGAVLLAAHLFSDLLAHVAASRDDIAWREILQVGREDLAVTIGSVAAALLMAVAALVDLDTRAALVGCVVLGLVAVAAVSFAATSAHRPLVRLLMAGVATALGTIIVVLENTF